MNPVIGLDVSKGESHAQAFLDRGVPHGKIFRFNHDLEGLSSQRLTGRSPSPPHGSSPSQRLVYAFREAAEREVPRHTGDTSL